MDTMENNYALANTMINYNNLLENYHRNDILRQMVTELHIGTCQLNGAVENLANVVGNSIDKQTEALRKRKYILVDKFYNVYDEIVKMKYDEEKKCFMMFGKNHSWKIFITSNMDEYNFERLNTKLSYSELYDTIITLDYLVNAFGVEYSMDLFNSKITTENWKKLNVLLNKSKDLALEKSFKISDCRKESDDAIHDSTEKINNLEIELDNCIQNSDSGIEFVIISSIALLFSILGIILGVIYRMEVILILGIIFVIVSFPFLGAAIWDYYHYKQEYNSVEQLSTEIKTSKDALDNVVKERRQLLDAITDEYDTKLKDVNNKIEEFVKSLCK